MTNNIASAFVEARRSWSALTDYPGTRPTDLASAYSIQDQALALWQRPIGGWKVGKINPPHSDALGANRLIGPVFTDLIQTEGADDGRFRTFAGGFAAVEAEFMLRLAPQDGPLPTTPAEAMNWVDEIRIGLEVASSPYADINKDGPCVTVSDHGNNAGLILGKVVPKDDWVRLDDIQVSLLIDGETVGQATTATMLDGPFGAVCFLLNNLAERRITPQPGWWISTGAITGVHEINQGAAAEGHFDGLGTIKAHIE